MIYFALACAIASWVLAVREMQNDSSWDDDNDNTQENDR